MGTIEEQRWARLFQEQQRSGQTVSAFCSSRGINFHSFKNKRTQWNKKQELQSGASNHFVELLPEEKVVVRIVLKNGRTLEIPSNFQESIIRRLIEVLESC
jgi:hypothetical protein